MRRTLIIPNGLAFCEARLHAARNHQSGLEILSLPQVAARLAGGFLQRVTRETLLSLVRDALRSGGFKQLDKIVSLPGLERAVTATLEKAWNADLDLQSRSKASPRLADIAAIERRVVKAMPSGMRVSRDLVNEAVERIEHAPRVLGNVHVQGIADANRCWRRLLVQLAGIVQVEWHAVPGADEDLAWLKSTKAKIITAKPESPGNSFVMCANQKHEVLEALRWARELIVSGKARPRDIAIVSIKPEEWDDYVRTLTNDSRLPVHFVCGRSALSTYPGQQAASLANILLRGLSKERFIRLCTLCRKSFTKLSSLPDRWDQSLPRNAPLLRFTDWRRALDDAAASGWPEDVDQRPILLPLLEILEHGTEAAEEAGAMLLSGEALSFWRRALLEGPPAALGTTLSGLRVKDERDPTSSIIFGTDRHIIGAPRRFVRLLGMTRRGWPRAISDDAILPDHTLSAGLLEPIPTVVQDRRNLARILATTSGHVVFSRSRRDREGRLLGSSPLIPVDMTPEILERARIPLHALTESDRLQARPSEFNQSKLGISSRSCSQDWQSQKITPHDGQVQPNHPLIEKALERMHSATSLRKLLRDPLGFVWTYALRWRAPEQVEEPLILDALAFGSLVHKILEVAVSELEQKPSGFAEATDAKLKEAVASATRSVSGHWQLETPIPPKIIWQQYLERAEESALRALSFDEKPLEGQRSWVEVPFGPRCLGIPPESLPWQADKKVRIPGVELEITGWIDRLDLDAARKNARVSDYKTGMVPKDVDGLSIGGGRELQRCLYSFAVRILLPTVRSLEARLIYPGDGGGIYPLADPERSLEEVAHYLGVAMKNLRQGKACPGPETWQDFNHLKLALPANASGFYLERKVGAIEDALGELTYLWQQP